MENPKYVSLFEANTGQLYPSGSHANVSVTLRFELPKVMHDKINKILSEYWFIVVIDEENKMNIVCGHKIYFINQTNL